MAALAEPTADPALSPRDSLASLTLADEAWLDERLIAEARLGEEVQRRVDALARRLVHAARAGRRKHGGVDALMHEYALSSEEGIALMCLAEALLRIPDAETADRLIADKLGGGDWDRHLGHSDSLLVNASTWGLMLTGRVVHLGREDEAGLAGALKRLVARSGEPLIRQAMRQAMRIMGRQFVLGRTIEEALALAKPDEERGYRFSYDMLGEAAVTANDAARYHAAYAHAIEAVGRAAGGGTDIFAAPSVSVKLSALHPRYEARASERVRAELVPSVVDLAALARGAGIGLTIDAEEQERLDLSLQVFEALAAEPRLAGWDGLGLAVQAYGKRATGVLDWLAALAAATGRRIPVRLVKGAYWDSEIKRAQEAGLADYPVFTRKVASDVSYLACARRLLAGRDEFFPQFATHNAHTLAAVAVLAGNRRDFEFQRLHGMGQALYEEVVPDDRMGLPCRIYAPVGTHEDLLAYLVRRLLENGANASFVNRLADDEAPVAEIVADPVDILSRTEPKRHPRIPVPPDLFLPERRNSRGLPLWEEGIRKRLLHEIRQALAEPTKGAPIVAGRAVPGEERPVTSPHDRRVTVGSVIEADAGTVDRALAAAVKAQPGWDRRGGHDRARLLERAADLYEREQSRLLALLIREAGKTLDNALSDLREAVDFLRYYAGRARADFSEPLRLPGPTGEQNLLFLHGRGVFACISPWNFPLAIFTGQVAAALAAGNSVVTKPAEQTPLVACAAVRLMHEAGVPVGVLHVLPGPGEVVGAALVADPRVAGVAFTGSNATAEAIHRTLAARRGPIVPLIAETGGINAMIVDSSALPEQAVRDAVRSAFDSAGQRCSAARVLFVQDDIAGKLVPMLAGAVEELRIGDPLDYATDVGPVIDEAARQDLEGHRALMRRSFRAIVELPLPQRCENGTFVPPSVYEVEALSQIEREVFGPVLHVIRFRGDQLQAVCESINAAGYGLTLGLHTRIQATADFVAEHVRVGNLYVNRNQIGAVVGVQPFGGEGLSGTGPKAGGPFYLHRFAVERTRSTDTTASGGNASLLALAAEGP